MVSSSLQLQTEIPGYRQNHHDKAATSEYPQSMPLNQNNNKITYTTLSSTLPYIK